MKLKSYVQGQWAEGSGVDAELLNAWSGEKVAEASSKGLDFADIMQYGRSVGGPALRKMTFHDRGRMLKALAKHLLEHKAEFYELSPWTGATKIDSWIDIEGGIGTLFTYSGKGRREAADQPFYIDGDMEHLSQAGTFVGQHICVPLEGVAVHINAFNFPVWGMLEKLAPTLLAGMPAVVKPALPGSYLTERVVRSMIDSGILPEGAVQLVVGEPREILDHLTLQDVVAFTGSISTGMMLKQKKEIVDNAVRFNMETDSLNCAILGPDAKPDTEEFGLFIKEVVKEMTVKAGQKCTAIRRTIVPESLTEPVIDALNKALDKVVIGDPSSKETRMGPLATTAQVEEVGNRVRELAHGAEVVRNGNGHAIEAPEGSAVFPITLLHCSEPFSHLEPHDVEAFGPVSTVMPYKNTEEAIELARMGRGSLVGSIATYDDAFARQVVLGLGAWHGRVLVLNRDCAKESTGHGSPLPHLLHGGPGRAGSGEELGGMRGTLHYMQRVALQGSPTTLGRITGRYLRGMRQTRDRVHPFQKHFEELEIGETLITPRRTVTEADVTNFAGVSGDFFYAHTDEIAAENNFFFKKRVAHGYLVLAMAAGLFVWPGEGPVLANYGLDNLRFVEPVYIGDTIRVTLTVKEKTFKEPKEEGEPPSGIVEWAVEITNQDMETVATYSILTLVKRLKD